MLLPKSKANFLGGTFLGRLANGLGRRIGSAEIHTNSRPQRRVETRQVRLIHETRVHGLEERFKVRTAEFRACPELGERVDLLPDGVKVDVGRGVLVESLRQVCVDAQELLSIPTVRFRGGLCFERGKQRLEPFE